MALSRDWTTTASVDAASTLLGRAINRHPLLVLRALRMMLLQGCHGIMFRYTSSAYIYLLAHIGKATKGIDSNYALPKEQRLPDVLTRAAAALRQAPPFVLPTAKEETP